MVTLFLSLIERKDAPHSSCTGWTYGSRAAASVLRGEHKGDSQRNFDDFLLHGWLICFVRRIAIFCRIEVSDWWNLVRFLYMPFNTLWTAGMVENYSEFKYHALACLKLFVCLRFRCLSDRYFNPNYLLLLSTPIDCFSSNSNFFVLLHVELKELRVRFLLFCTFNLL